MFSDLAFGSPLSRALGLDLAVGDVVVVAGGERLASSGLRRVRGSSLASTCLVPALQIAQPTTNPPPTVTVTTDVP